MASWIEIERIRKDPTVTNGLSLWVVADVPLPPRAARYESFLELAKGIGRLLVGGSKDENDTRITVHLPLSLGQQIYRQLLPGQRLLVTL